MDAQTFASRLEHVKRSGTGWTARCPAHDDRTNSLSINAGDDGRILLKCFAGCSAAEVAAAMDLTLADLFPDKGQGGRGEYPPVKITSTPQHTRKAASGQAKGVERTDASSEVLRQHSPAGCTLAAYAAAKGIPVAVLKSFGLTQISYQSTPAVRMPYFDTDGNVAASRYRVALTKDESGDNRFRWKSGDKPCLYGLSRLSAALQVGYVVLVEGESDCHTLWHHGIPAIGLPGAANWNEQRDAPHLADVPVIYVILEPDRGGEAVRRWLSASAIRERVRLVTLDGAGDPSELYLQDPEAFVERWQAAMRSAIAWQDMAAAEAGAERDAAWLVCEELARDPHILARFAEALTADGFAGSLRGPQLLYLALTSRLLSRPVSVVMKAPSSAGKSYAVERTTAFFPADAYYALSSMSPKALAYDTEPLQHRILIVYEAAGAADETASYLLRTLLSEGHIRHSTVEATKDGVRPRLVEREGPTGVILTTTAARLHPENETRMLSIPVDDSQTQTRNVMLAIAAGRRAALPEDDVNEATWHALQTWLRLSTHSVEIPYAVALAELIPPVAVRLRRDFATVLNLIRAHAILQQATRERDEHGNIRATIDDYLIVRSLIVDLVSEGVEATVSPTVRETVTAVRDLTANADDTVSVQQLVKRLHIDKAAVSRRVSQSRQLGYLVNLEDKKGRPARIVIGTPMPDDLVILPAADVLAKAMQIATDEPTHDVEPPTALNSCQGCGAPLYLSTCQRRVLCVVCRERRAA